MLDRRREASKRERNERGGKVVDGYETDGRNCQAIRERFSWTY